MAGSFFDLPEPPLCVDCGKTKIWYRTPCRDLKVPPTHYFICRDCGSVTEVRTPRQQNDWGSLPTLEAAPVGGLFPSFDVRVPKLKFDAWG